MVVEAARGRWRIGDIGPGKPYVNILALMCRNVNNLWTTNVAIPNVVPKIVEIFSTLIPQLDEAQKASVLAFGEGMAFLVNQQRAKEN